MTLGACALLHQAKFCYFPNERWCMPRAMPLAARGTPLASCLAHVGDEGLVGERAAVDADVLAGDERRLVRGEKDHGGGDVLGAAQARRDRGPHHGGQYRLLPTTGLGLRL